MEDRGATTPDASDPDPAVPAAPEHRPAPRAEEPAAVSPRGGWVTRLAVRALVAVAAGVMATGFLDWRAGALVAVLVVLTYVLLATVGPRMPPLWGAGRLLRLLRRAGYHVVPDGLSRYVLVGERGVYLLETRVWQQPVAWTEGEWWIGDVPARRVFDRLGQHAARVTRELRLPDTGAGVEVVPVVVVRDRLPQPAMQAGTAIIARPRAAARHLAAREAVLEPAEVTAILDETRE